MITPAQHWASDYACRLQSILEHQPIDEFIKTQHAQMEAWNRVGGFVRAWIVLPMVLNQIHTRVLVVNRLKRFAVSTLCFLAACFVMGESDLWALGFYVALNAFTIWVSDL